MAAMKQVEILQLHEAVISARLANSRSALLTNIDVAFVAALPHAASSSEQILCDLDALNTAGVLADGSVPLVAWLANAVALARGRAEEAIFFQALARCDVSGRVSTTYARRPEVLPHGSGTAAAQAPSNGPTILDLAVRQKLAGSALLIFAALSLTITRNGFEVAFLCVDLTLSAMLITAKPRSARWTLWRAGAGVLMGFGYAAALQSAGMLLCPVPFFAGIFGLLYGNPGRIRGLLSGALAFGAVAVLLVSVGLAASERSPSQPGSSSSSSETRDVTLRYPIGIVGVTSADFLEIFPAGRSLPAVYSQTFVTSDDEQPSVRVALAQNRPGGAEQICDFQVRGIPAAPKTTQSVILTVSVSEIHQVSIKATVQGTGTTSNFGPFTVE